MDDNELNEIAQAQAEKITITGFYPQLIADVISLRISIEAVIFYLEFENGHERMIDVLQHTLNGTFNPEMDDNDCVDLAA